MGSQVYISCRRFLFVQQIIRSLFPVLYLVSFLILLVSYFQDSSFLFFRGLSYDPLCIYTLPILWNEVNNFSRKFTELKRLLTHEFKGKDLGNLKYFLEMEFARPKIGIVVSQHNYVLECLKKTGMLSCKPTNIDGSHLQRQRRRKQHSYLQRNKDQRLVGKLI